MLELVKVAVTGGIASGKSSACRFFKELGAHVVSADNIVHRLLSPETKVGLQVIHLLGPEIVTKGQISRRAIAKKVFNNPLLLEALEKIIHPAVNEELDKEVQRVRSEKEKINKTIHSTNWI